jgi:hypothetical protein
MSKWGDKCRKRREDRSDEAHRQEDAERKRLEELERRRRQEELNKRIYNLQMQKIREKKAQDQAMETEASRRHQQMVDAQQLRHEGAGYDPNEDEY